ncbi:MAG: glutamine synthetase family protein [Pseudomonadota bacterium]
MTRSTAQEFADFIAAHPKIERFDGFVFDLSGHARGKRYTRAAAQQVFAHGAQVSNSTFLMDVTGAVLDAGGRGFSDGDPDALAQVVPGTLCPIPWLEKPAAQFLLSMAADPPGLPNLDPRVIAGKALAALQRRGLRAVVAFEIEFYLMEARVGRDGTPLPPKGRRSAVRHDQHQVYGMDLLADFEPVIEDILAACEVQGLPVTVASTEYGLGQFEANLLHHDDALAAADQCLLLRRAVRGAAARHGLKATFMAKPYLDDAGNGMHVNLSLGHRNGGNVFYAKDGMSAVMRHAIGGLQAALAESVAIFAPNRNAYRRYGANLFVPVNRHWGIGNRSVAFRAILGSPAAQRIEHRFGAADANPYLALAAIIAGVLHGLDGALDPGPPMTGNASAALDPDLPFDFDAALGRMAAGDILANVMADYVGYYVDAKRRELAKLRRPIPPLEHRWYL